MVTTFGHGMHSCPAMRFSITSIQLLIGALAREFDFEPLVLNAVEARNSSQKRVLFEKIERRFGGDLDKLTIGVWGLSFKPRTDDVREAPALVLIDRMLELGAQVHVHDPEAMAKIVEIAKN